MSSLSPILVTCSLLAPVIINSMYALKGEFSYLLCLVQSEQCGEVMGRVVPPYDYHRVYPEFHIVHDVWDVYKPCLPVFCPRQWSFHPLEISWTDINTEERWGLKVLIIIKNIEDVLGVQRQGFQQISILAEVDA